MQNIHPHLNENREYGIPYSRIVCNDLKPFEEILAKLPENPKTHPPEENQAESSSGDSQSTILNFPVLKKSAFQNRLKYAKMCARKCPKSLIVKIAASAFFSVSFVGIFFVLLSGTLKIWLEALQKSPSFYGPLVFTLLFLITSFPFAWGYIVLNLAAGFIYKFQMGLMVVVLGASFGCFLSFWLCGKFGRNYIQKKLAHHEKFRAILRVVEGKQGLKIIALMRLTPIPFGLQNAIFSASKIGTFRYLFASMAGLFPTQVLNTYLGTTLKNMNDIFQQSGGTSLFNSFFLASQIFIGFVLSSFVFRLAKKELDKNVEDEDDGFRETVVLPLEMDAFRSSGVLRPFSFHDEDEAENLFDAKRNPQEDDFV